MAKKKEESTTEEPKDEKIKKPAEEKAVEGEVVTVTPQQPAKEGHAGRYLACCGIGCVILILLWLLLGFLPFIIPVPMMPRIF